MHWDKGAPTRKKDDTSLCYILVSEHPHTEHEISKHKYQTCRCTSDVTVTANNFNPDISCGLKFRIIVGEKAKINHHEIIK